MNSDKTLEILRLYDNEHLTQRQIASRLGMTQQNVSKNLKKIPQKDRSCISCRKRGIVTKDLKNLSLWRYHSLQFLIHPYYLFPRYEKIRKERGGWFTNSDWLVKLHKENVELRLRRGFDFLDKDKFESIHKAEESLNRTLYNISNSCGFKYEKEGRISIKLVKQHLAKTNSTFAKGLKKDYIQVRGVDGKVWFLIDKSKGLLEHEYIHPSRLMQDSEAVEGFLDDLRLNPHILRDTANTINQIVKVQETEIMIQKSITENQQLYAENIKEHIEAIRTLGSKVNILGNQVKEFVKIIKMMKK